MDSDARSRDRSSAAGWRSRTEARLHRSMIVLYIDPVSGSLLFQSLIAGFLGAVAFWRKTIWAFFTRLFGSKRNREH